MNGALVRLSGAFFVLLLVVGMAAVVYTSEGRGPIEVKAEFESANPILEGNHVRVRGVVAGSVDKLELTERGTALMTMHLHDGAMRPRRDAVATIRAEDFLGENYVSLSLGDDPAPLRSVIPVARTAQAPRLSDVLDTMRQPVRVGLQALFVELGRAMEHRGDDLNRAIVELKPALEATKDVLEALGSQRASLRALIADARRATKQVAARDRDLDGQLVALDEVLGVTARRSGDLARGLDALPPTLRQARGTLSRTRRFAASARPLARALADLAPGLADTARTVGPFATRATRAAEDLRPTLKLTRKLLAASNPAVPDLTNGLARLREASPELADFMRFSGPQVVRSLGENFFEGRSTVTVEPGDQPTQPEDPLRFYYRGLALFTCESVGKPKQAGCLGDFLREHGVTPPSEELNRRKRSRKADPAPLPNLPLAARPAPKVKLPAARVPSVRVPKPTVRIPSPGRDVHVDPRPAERLLDFLLKP